MNCLTKLLPAANLPALPLAHSSASPDMPEHVRLTVAHFNRLKTHTPHGATYSKKIPTSLDELSIKCKFMKI